jgi:putative ABC transport system ATP-binding protein
MLLRKEIKANRASGIIVTHSHAAAATADRVLLLTKEGLHDAPAITGSAQLTTGNAMPTPPPGGIG